MRKPKSKQFRLQKQLSEAKEIELLQSWIDSGKPDSGSNPLSLPPLPKDSKVGRIDGGTFSRYAGCCKFSQLPVSQKTKDGLTESKFKKMTDVQRASLPHSLCGRDILGAAKTGSGKTLAFIIPVLEKLYRERWGPEDGVGCIIMSPTRELASQLFEVLKSAGRHHNFSAGLLIGGRKDVDTEKERVNELNILICTPGRLLQHMDETPNFECSELQVLVLDEADRILDVGFKKELNAIISQLPKHRQTLLFSATQTKSVQDLARLSLKDPEYIGVHEESVTATPTRLHQTVIIVPLDKKLDMLWSFIKAHLNSRMLVFLTSCKQVKFVFETFKKLHPGIPLKCLHGRMKQDVRMGIYSQFCEKRSVLLSTDVAARGLDFNKAVDWVVQVDCPDDPASYIHRVGRTARYLSGGKSVLFLEPSEMKMLEKLREKKVPIHFIKANRNRIQSVSGLVAALLVKYPNLQYLAQRAFVTYLKSIYKQRDKEVFNVSKLPIDEFSASLGLPMTPKIRFLKSKTKDKKLCEDPSSLRENVAEENLLLPSEGPSSLLENVAEDNLLLPSRENLDVSGSEKREEEDDFLLSKESSGKEQKIIEPPNDMLARRVLKKKKLKINAHRPVGTRVVFDEEGNPLPPLAMLADTQSSSGSVQVDQNKVYQRYAEKRRELKIADKEDKIRDRERRREKRIKEKMKLKKGAEEGTEDEGDLSGSDEEMRRKEGKKRSKMYFNSDNDDDENNGENAKVGLNADSISVAEQEELALKLLNSMNS